MATSIERRGASGLIGPKPAVHRAAGHPEALREGQSGGDRAVLDQNQGLEGALSLPVRGSPQQGGEFGGVLLNQYFARLTD